jgi:hypothetical protein
MDAWRFFCAALMLVAASWPSGRAQARSVPETVHYEHVEANSTKTFTVNREAGVTTFVRLVAEGGWDVQLAIYDVNGNLLSLDEDAAADAFVAFVPRWSGPYTFTVANPGPVGVDVAVWPL